jgi:hypothetical protein
MPTLSRGAGTSLGHVKFSYPCRAYLPAWKPLPATPSLTLLDWRCAPAIPRLPGPGHVPRWRYFSLIAYRAALTRRPVRTARARHGRAAGTFPPGSSATDPVRMCVCKKADVKFTYCLRQSRVNDLSESTLCYREPRALLHRRRVRRGIGMVRERGYTRCTKRSQLRN